MDQNWYTQDISRRPPKQTPHVWVRLLAIDPDSQSLPWDFHGHMPSASGTLLAKSIESRPDRAIAAQKIANLFVSRDRIDLAEPLLPIAESGKKPTPELFALRAEISQLDGDSDGYIKNLESAWKAAPPENATRSIWLYEWASELLANHKGAEANARSPDPGRTFYDLAMDEDGYLMLTSKQLQELSDALQNASTDEESAGKWLRVWQRLAPVTVMMQRTDYQAAWESLSTFLAKEASAGDRRVAELMTELELTWTVQDWMTTAAVHTNHAAEAWDLMPEGDRLSSLLWKIDKAEFAESLTGIVEKLRQENPADPDVKFCEALAADLKEETPTAIQKYHEFMQQPDFEESPFRYRVHNGLVEMALNQSDWTSPIAVLPPGHSSMAGLKRISLLALSSSSRCCLTASITPQNGSSKSQWRATISRQRKPYSGPRKQILARCRAWQDLGRRQMPSGPKNGVSFADVIPSVCTM